MSLVRRAVDAAAVALVVTGLAACPKKDAEAPQPEDEVDLETPEEVGRRLLREMFEALAEPDELVIEAIRFLPPELREGVEGPEQERILLRLERPGRLHVTVTAPGITRVYAYDGRELTVSDEASRVYAVTRYEGELNDLSDQLTTRPSLAPPLLAFLRTDLYERVAARLRSVRYVDREGVGGVFCDRVAYVGERLEGDVWIDPDSRLPCRLTLTPTTTADADTTLQGEVRVDFMSWDLDPDLETEDLQFVPPPDAERRNLPPLVPPEDDEEAALE